MLKSVMLEQDDDRLPYKVQTSSDDMMTAPMYGLIAAVQITAPTLSY